MGAKEPVLLRITERHWDYTDLSVLLLSSLKWYGSSKHTSNSPSCSAKGKGRERRDEFQRFWMSLMQIGKRLKRRESNSGPLQLPSSEAEIKALIAWLLSPSNQLSRIAATELQRFMLQEILLDPRRGEGSVRAKDYRQRAPRLAEMLATHFMATLFAPRPPT